MISICENYGFFADYVNFGEKTSPDEYATSEGDILTPEINGDNINVKTDGIPIISQKTVEDSVKGL